MSDELSKRDLVDESWDCDCGSGSSDAFFCEITMAVRRGLDGLPCRVNCEVRSGLVLLQEGKDVCSGSGWMVGPCQ